MQEKNIHRTFEITIILKGLHAIIELVSGTLLYFVSVATINALTLYIVSDEVGDDPNDFIANYLLHAAQNISVGGKTFAALYLLSHGAVKLFVIVGLLRQKRWAYPSAIIVLGAFIAYQLYRFTFTHSIFLIVLTVFDLVVIGLTWHEYRLIRENKPLE